MTSRRFSFHCSLHTVCINVSILPVSILTSLWLQQLLSRERDLNSGSVYLLISLDFKVDGCFLTSILWWAQEKSLIFSLYNFFPTLSMVMMTSSILHVGADVHFLWIFFYKAVEFIFLECPCACSRKAPTQVVLQASVLVVFPSKFHSEYNHLFIKWQTLSWDH